MAPILDLFTRHEGRPHGNPEAQVLNPDPQTILSRWRSLNPRSIDRQQIATLVDDKKNRDIALKFRGKDAATVVNIIDQVLKRDLVPHETKAHAFKLLRKLAGASRQVPKSYLVGRLTRYRVNKDIFASGGFADIREGRLKGKVVAIKTIRTSLQTKLDELHETFCKECVLWMNISHPNILQLIAVKIEPGTGRFSMISELMTNGNILNYIRDKKANRLRLLEDVARGLEHLHKSGIIHGDMKGPNVLINNEASPRACISDFGFSTVAPSVSFDPTTCKANAGGTFGYMAPELFVDDPWPSKEADMYAFGIVIYEVVTGVLPFGRRRVALLVPTIEGTIEGARPNRPEDPVAVGFGQGTWEFAEKCWGTDRERRPTVREALEHFGRVAKTSKVVDPGPTIPGHGTAGEAPSRMESSSQTYSKLFACPSIPSSSRLQQTTLTARALVTNQNPLTPFLPADEESNLLGPMRRGVKSLRPTPRLAASPQGGN